MAGQPEDRVEHKGEAGVGRVNRDARPRQRFGTGGSWPGEQAQAGPKVLPGNDLEIYLPAQRVIRVQPIVGRVVSRAECELILSAGQKPFASATTVGRFLKTSPTRTRLAASVALVTWGAASPADPAVVRPIARRRGMPVGCFSKMIPLLS